MRNSIFLILLILIIGRMLDLIGPWWLPLIACFGVCAWKAGSGWRGFWIGGFGMALFWLGTALYLENRDVTGLSGKISALFTGNIPALGVLPGSVPVYLILLLIAFLLGGLAGLSGANLRKL